MARKPRKQRSLYNEIGDRKTVYVKNIDDDKPKGKPQFQGGKFMLVGLQTYKIIRELKLHTSARLVLDWLCEHSQFGNTVTDWTQQEIARDCRLYRTRVSSVMRLLEVHQLILVRGRGVATLNPYLWYRGDLQQQQEACERWDAYQAERGQVWQPRAVPQA